MTKHNFIDEMCQCTVLRVLYQYLSLGNYKCIYKIINVIYKKNNRRGLSAFLSPELRHLLFADGSRPCYRLDLCYDSD